MFFNIIRVKKLNGYKKFLKIFSKRLGSWFNFLFLYYCLPYYFYFLCIFDQFSPLPVKHFLSFFLKCFMTFGFSIFFYFFAFPPSPFDCMWWFTFFDILISNLTVFMLFFFLQYSSIKWKKFHCLPRFFSWTCQFFKMFLNSWIIDLIFCFVLFLFLWLF